MERHNLYQRLIQETDWLPFSRNRLVTGLFSSHTHKWNVDKYLPGRFVTIRYFTSLSIAVLVKATLPFWDAFQRDHLTVLLDQAQW